MAATTDSSLSLAEGLGASLVHLQPSGVDSHDDGGTVSLLPLDTLNIDQIFKIKIFPAWVIEEDLVIVGEEDLRLLAGLARQFPRDDVPCYRMTQGQR